MAEVTIERVRRTLNMFGVVTLSDEVPASLCVYNDFRDGVVTTCRNLQIAQASAAKQSVVDSKCAWAIAVYEDGKWRITQTKNVILSRRPINARNTR